MQEQHDPIMSLLRDAQTLAVHVTSAKGALLECHSGKVFHGFDDIRYTSNTHRHLISLHAVLKVLQEAGSYCKGATLYMTAPPCLTCSEAILASGIRRVVHPDHQGDDDDEYLSCEQGNMLLGLNGVEVELWSPTSYAMN